MNERIRELAFQAGFVVDQSGHIMVCFTSDGNDEVKKFAELIVRKCIQSIQNESMNSGDEWEDGLRIAENAIKQHFGVE